MAKAGRKPATNEKVIINGREYNYYRIVRKIGSKQKTFRGKNSAEAEAKYKKALAEYKESQLLGDKITFGQWADEWIDKVYWDAQYHAERTKASYVSAWNRHVATSDIYDKKVTDVGTTDIMQLYKSMECPRSTVKKCHNLMLKYYDYLSAEGICFNYARNATIPTTAKDHVDDESTDVEVWTPGELSNILDGLYDYNQIDGAGFKGFRYALLVQLAVCTGARISELLALKKSDFHFYDYGEALSYVSIRRQITPYKRGDGKAELVVADLKSKRSRRDIPLARTIDPFQINAVLPMRYKREGEKYGWTWGKKHDDYLFLTKTGHFVDKANLRRALERYYEWVDVDFKSIHTYRHTFATQCYKQGVPLEECSRLMGHSSATVTAKYYVGISREQSDKALKPFYGFLSDL